jgi:phage tail sheath gpL-like
MTSDAVGIERISRIVGYKIIKGNFQESSPNLPQRVALLAEANTDNQTDLSVEPLQITSAQQAGIVYGYGSPIYLAARILFPKQGGGIGGIPVVVYAQEEAIGATAKIIEIEPAGVATSNGVHTLVIAGRTIVDGASYDIEIVAGDTTAEITAKITDVINNVLGSPVTATDTDYTAELTSKWKGLTANGLSVTVDDNGDSLGITYTITTLQAGAGTPSVADSLESFGNNWNTIVINSYGAVPAIITELESYNGVPDPTTPTGRFAGIVMKPFIALTGSVLEDPSSITDADARKPNVTIAICPAPLSAGLALEAAANMAVLFAVVSQNSPHLDVAGKNYPDMPTPLVIGAMSDYNNRDVIVKKGCSTVDLAAGYYKVMDFVTTYHPVGETPPQFSFCRNLVVDFNVYYGYYLLEQTYVVDHAIAADSDTVTASKVIKPKQWKAVLKGYASDLSKRALIVTPEFMVAGLVVNLSTSNPDRLETAFPYKRSGFVRIASTTAQAGFNFGTLN